MSGRMAAIVDMLDSRKTRRRALQWVAVAAGSLLLLKPAMRGRALLVHAQEHDENDSSGRGRGRGRGGDEDNRGPGNADDREAENQGEEDALVAVIEVVPEGALEVHIVSDDAGGFVPGELVVELGQLVAFVNGHDDDHTATGSGFDTGVIGPGRIATVELNTPGTFVYACRIHPEMTGSISVRGEDGVIPPEPIVSETAPDDARPVRVFNFSFDPAEITVPTGSSVTWTNDDSVPHTVTSSEGLFDSGVVDPGASFTWTFDQPGTFAYVCQLHPQMQGTVIAQGAPTAIATPTTSESGAVSEMQPVETSTDLAVAIVDFAFEPVTVNAFIGATIVWTNNGRVPHTVTGGFADSGILEPGAMFSHTFTEQGEFRYACALHPNMVGTISVSHEATQETDQSLSNATDASRIPGVWQLEFVPNDLDVLVVQQALVTLRSDATIEADFMAAADTRVPASLLGTGHGKWVVEDQLLAVTLVALVANEEHRFAGTMMIEAQGQLSASSRVFDGEFTYTVVSPAGESVLEGSGTVRGDLVPLDPLPDQAP